jgi:hypothetical protein
LLVAGDRRSVPGGIGQAFIEHPLGAFLVVQQT